jgi:lipid-A-disaccharide synthase
MRRDRPDAYFFGIGGTRMRQAGVDVDVLTNHLGTVGITEVFRHVVAFARLAWRTRQRILADRPDVAILIANDLFNAGLARWLRRQGVATVGYFPPQIWVWGAVLGAMSKGFDLVLTAFPEEQEAYAQVLDKRRAVFVGHYLTNMLEPVSAATRAGARKTLGLPEEGRVVALLAGSREHEVRRLAPVLMGAARRLLANDPGTRFVTPVAEPALRPAIEQAIASDGLQRSIVCVSNSHDAMRASDLVLGSSGTSTLETALLGIPMVVAYRVSAITHLVIRACFKTGLLAPRPTSLPNLLLGQDVVPEFLQGRATADAVASEAWSILSSPARQAQMRADLAAAVARVIVPNPIGAAAGAVYGLMAAGDPGGRSADRRREA